jgi:hypothetical protein
MQVLIEEMTRDFRISEFWFEGIPTRIMKSLENWLQAWGRETTLAALRVVAKDFDEYDRISNANPPGGGMAGEMQMAASMWAIYVHKALNYVEALPVTEPTTPTS